MISAMPAIVEAAPSVCYVILGTTRPGRSAGDGEAYRAALEAQAAALGVSAQRQVRGPVRRSRRAWDVARGRGRVRDSLSQTSTGPCRAPSPTPWPPARPIVSTPYAYASEMLADGRGQPRAPRIAASALRKRSPSLLLRRRTANRDGPASIRAQPRHGVVGGGPPVPAHLRPGGPGARQAGPASQPGGRRCLTRAASLAQPVIPPNRDAPAGPNLSPGRAPT